MNIRKLLSFILAISFIAPVAHAQLFGGKHRSRSHSTFGRNKPPYRYEVIGSIGATNFLGDLGGANQIGTHGFKDLEASCTRPSLGISGRIKIQQFFSVKANLIWGMIAGDDKLTTEPFRSSRNLNFRSHIVELSAQIEFNFIREQKGHVYRISGVRGMKHKDKSVYLFAGGGMLYFNPQGQTADGEWHYLEPLHTEGQSGYSLITGIISVGGGFRVAINRYWGVGLELGMRKTFSDYLDDVSKNYPDPAIFNGNPTAQQLSNAQQPGSPAYCYPCTGEQRGDHTNNDAYMFGAFTVGYKVMHKKRSRSKF